MIICQGVLPTWMPTTCKGRSLWMPADRRDAPTLDKAHRPASSQAYRDGLSCQASSKWAAVFGQYAAQLPVFALERVAKG